MDKLTSDEAIALFNVANNLAGAQSAASRLADVAIRLGYTRIEIGYEATGMLWIPFHRFLSTCRLLAPFDLQQVCFSPKLVPISRMPWSCSVPVAASSHRTRA